MLHADWKRGGDVMSLEEWVNHCMDGSFIDYDGHARYADPGTQTVGDEIVYPSQAVAGTIDHTKSHVVWFNR